MRSSRDAPGAMASATVALLRVEGGSTPGKSALSMHASMAASGAPPRRSIPRRAATTLSCSATSVCSARNFARSGDPAEGTEAFSLDAAVGARRAERPRASTARMLRAASSRAEGGSAGAAAGCAIASARGVTLLGERAFGATTTSPTTARPALGSDGHDRPARNFKRAVSLRGGASHSLGASSRSVLSRLGAHFGTRRVARAPSAPASFALEDGVVHALLRRERGVQDDGSEPSRGRDALGRRLPGARPGRERVVVSRPRRARREVPVQLHRLPRGHRRGRERPRPRGRRGRVRGRGRRRRRGLRRRPGRRRRDHDRRRVRRPPLPVRRPAPRLPRAHQRPPEDDARGRQLQDRALPRAVPPPAPEDRQAPHVRQARVRLRRRRRSRVLRDHPPHRPPRRLARDQVRHGVPLPARGRAVLPRGPHRLDPRGRLQGRDELRPLHRELRRRRRGRGSRGRRLRGARARPPPRGEPRGHPRGDQLRRLLRRREALPRLRSRPRARGGGVHVGHVRDSLRPVVGPRGHLREAQSRVRGLRRVGRHPRDVRPHGRFLLGAVRPRGLACVRQVPPRVRPPRRAPSRVPQAQAGGALGVPPGARRSRRQRGDAEAGDAAKPPRRPPGDPPARDVREQPRARALQVPGPRVLPRGPPGAHAAQLRVAPERPRRRRARRGGPATPPKEAAATAPRRRTRPSTTR